MPNEWYYKNNNNTEIGPISAVDLKNLAKEGIIIDETLVKKGNGSWVRGKMLKGLIPPIVNAHSKGLSPPRGRQEIDSGDQNSDAIKAKPINKIKKIWEI